MVDRLGARQQDVFRFIVRYQESYDSAPTVREIAEALGLGSTNTVDYHLKALEKKGFIRRRGNLARAIEIINRGDPGNGNPKGARVQRFPIVGEIAAGRPIQALEGQEEGIELPLSLAGTADAFVLRVRGTSMIDEHICDGDLVVVRPQQTARNGEIVVALLADNGVTLKKFYHEGTHIRLQPANASMAPIIIPAGEECAIQGTVSAVIRQAA